MALSRGELLAIHNVGEGSADDIVAAIERLREELANS
jgi:hypothetical protein